jgi:predicted DCC family thiol-disulfide oxidoreductase YuxK
MLHLVYDGDCGFCRRALAVAQRVDFGRRIRLHDATDRDAIRGEFPELANADLDDAMFAIDDGHVVTRGFFAFRRLAWESPLTWPLLVLFYLPGSGILGPRAYAWVARNRRRFGCESDVCESRVPPHR